MEENQRPEKHYPTDYLWRDKIIYFELPELDSGSM